MLNHEKVAVAAMPESGDPMDNATSPKAYGWGLFSKYMLPVQVTGFLLLIAMVGVIVISKRMKPSEEGRAQPRKVTL